MHSPMRGSTWSSRLLVLLVCAAMLAAMTPLALALPAEPTTWYVDDDAAPGGDGSEGAPFDSVSAAFQVLGEGDTIMIAAGIYSGMATGEDFPCGIEYDDVTIVGAGMDETVLDGLHMDQVLHIDADDVTVRDLTITGGRSNELQDRAVDPQVVGVSGGVDVYSSTASFEDVRFSECTSPDAGGAVWAYASEVDFSGCEFEDNGWWYESDVVPFGTQEDVYTRSGGGLYAYDSTVTVSACGFTGNAAGSGGAVTADHSSLSVMDSTFESNVATASVVMPDHVESAGPSSYPGAGGAIMLAVSDAVFSGSDFTGNEAVVGGALGTDVYSDMTATDCRFDGNRAIWGGAAFHTIDFLDERAADIDPPAIPGVASYDRCSFTGGESEIVAGVFSFANPLHLTNCLFADNIDSAFTVAALGEYIEAAPYEEAELSTATNCTFSDNVSGIGSLYMTYGYAWNSVFWGNTYTGGIADAGVAETVVPSQETTVTDVVAPGVAYSDLEYGYLTEPEDVDEAVAPREAPFPDGVGNISADPLFAGPDAGDYSLSMGSPAIDAGTSEHAPDVDIEGTERPIDGDVDGTAAWDMGAYEAPMGVVPGTVRLAGGDRYATSVRISRDSFSVADTVVIARGDVFADALAAAGLAGLYEAPILLTPSDDLPSFVADEIERLGAQHAIICGGAGAVSSHVQDELDAMGLDVDRIGGTDRYETAALIASHIMSNGGASEITFIARGDTFPDALAVSPVAYGLRAPVLLVQPGMLPDSTVGVLDEVGTSGVVLGGEGAVSGDVERLLDMDEVVRVGGADRYETAALISEYAVDEGWSRWSVTGIARGDDFPDALCGGPAVGAWGGVLLLTQYDALPAHTRSALEAHDASIIRTEILGGTGAINDGVMSEIAAIVD